MGLLGARLSNRAELRRSGQEAEMLVMEKKSRWRAAMKRVQSSQVPRDQRMEGVKMLVGLAENEENEENEEEEAAEDKKIRREEVQEQ